jgi:hypothetical protein
MPSKIASNKKAKPVGRANGFTFYVNHRKAKTKRGKDRLWVSVRQDGATREWRQTETLAYVYGVDILFTPKPQDVEDDDLDE